MKTTITHYEVYKAIRKDWGMVNPVTKAFKNKKAYNRKNKSWKTEED